MDMSNLSSNLPLSLLPTEESINNINKELSDEFKIGARSIAALYRLSNTKNSLLIAKGYLDCLNDLSNLLDSGKVSSIADLKQIISDKKSELTPSTKGEKSAHASQTQPELQSQTQQNSQVSSRMEQEGLAVNETAQAPLRISDSYKFTVHNPTTHHFPPARTPMSIDHSNLKYYVEKPNGRASRIRPGLNISQTEIAANTDEEEEEEVENSDNCNDQSSDVSFDSSDYSAMKRRLRDNITACKKQKN